ncbi:MAG: hypothetical protein SGI92_21285 [Bryobacteraceae bacterium]|nr:hypothetical protein [Bryobacteraceae bacterium]
MTRALAVALLACGVAHAQYAMREIDLHFHSGLEREVPMEEWIGMAAAGGRKVVLMLDHLELYRKSADEYEQWRAKGKFQSRYSMGAAGHREFFADVDRVAAAHQNLQIFKGWEIYEGELDTGMDLEAMKLVDAIGWHISPNNGREPPDGKTLLRRVAQVKEAQKKVPVPMILFHPFTMRLENIQRTAKAKGRDLKSITVAEYRFFKPGEQQELAAALKGTSIYIEISNSTAKYFEDPVCRQALIEDIRPLADMDVQFTVSTDAHHVSDATRPFQPETYCKELGCTDANTSGMVRELRAAKRRRR